MHVRASQLSSLMHRMRISGFGALPHVNWPEMGEVINNYAPSAQMAFLYANARYTFAERSLAPLIDSLRYPPRPEGKAAIQMFDSMIDGLTGAMKKAEALSAIDTDRGFSSGALAAFIAALEDVNSIGDQLVRAVMPLATAAQEAIAARDQYELVQTQTAVNEAVAKANAPGATDLDKADAWQLQQGIMASDYKNTVDVGVSVVSPEVRAASIMDSGSDIQTMVSQAAQGLDIPSMPPSIGSILTSKIMGVPTVLVLAGLAFFKVVPTPWLVGGGALYLYGQRKG